MPLIDSVHFEPEEAIAQGRCPECARALAEVNAEQHIAAHWPWGVDAALGNPEVTRRAQMIRAYAAEHADPAPVLLTEEHQGVTSDTPTPGR